MRMQWPRYLAMCVQTFCGLATHFHICSPSVPQALINSGTNSFSSVPSAHVLETGHNTDVKPSLNWVKLIAAKLF
jgi:hypothetical protein